LLRSAPAASAHGGDDAAVDLDHLPELIALLRCKRRQQHDAGIVDEDIGAAEFLVHTLSRRNKRVSVSHVRLNGNHFVAKLSCEGLDPVDPAGEQCEPVPACGQGAGCRRADP